MGGSETVVHRVDCIVALAFGNAETNALDLGRNHALTDPLSKEPWTNLLVLISYDDDDVNSSVMPPGPNRFRMQPLNEHPLGWDCKV